VKISALTRRAFDSYFEMRKPKGPEEPLFVARGWGAQYFTNGQRMTERALYQRIRRLGQRAGVATSPHKWRHTFAAFAVRNGANVKALQLFLGHSQLQTTDNYLRGFGFEDAVNEHQAFSPVKGMFQQH
jgi:integrase/recombinase XerD